MKEKFQLTLKSAIVETEFISLVLSKIRTSKSDLTKVSISPVRLSGNLLLQFVYTFQTKDITKNYKTDEAIDLIMSLLESDFKIANLYTLSNDFVFQQNNKYKWKLYEKKASKSINSDYSHDTKKKYFLDINRPFLKDIGITNDSCRIVKDMGDKYRQIQKFIEIIDELVSKSHDKELMSIVDMGSGKGYLTFALYDYLTNVKSYDISMKGIELRSHLVQTCNDLSKKHSYNNLEFLVGDIESSIVTKVDMLIALHACDTATDDAIYKGIQCDAKWIICSPCCQHQVRNEIQNISLLNGILKHGILMERMAEMLTDGIRALILEAYGYTTKVFEFISSEHTGKNLMIIAIKKESFDPNIKKEIWNYINKIKLEMGIKEHYLQSLFS